MKERRLLLELLRLIRQISVQAVKIRQNRYPTDSPDILVGIIDRLASSVGESFRTRCIDANEGGDAFLLELKQAICSVRTLASHLRFAERAITKRTPWSLISPLESLGARIHPKSLLLVRPKWIHNYSIAEYISYCREAYKDVFSKDQLDIILSDNGNLPIESLYIISFPFPERLNVLLHTLIGHELGHPIEKEFLDLPEEGARQTALRNEVRKHLPASITDALQQQRWLTQQFEKANVIRRRALAELTCDIVCTNIFGPAALFAIEEFASTSSLDNFSIIISNGLYPPWRYRMRVVFQSFEKDWLDNYLDHASMEPDAKRVVIDKWTQIEEVVNDHSDEAMLHHELASRLAYESVAVSLPEVRTFVSSRLNPLGLSIEQSICDVSHELLGRLQNWIPPDLATSTEHKEIGCSLPSILNVAWIHQLMLHNTYLLKDKNLSNLEEYFTEMDTVWRLTLKALEYAELRNKYTN